ncbi:MAG: GNAT family N-acetyltransferase [Vicinamibacterales bacterium]
MRSETSTSAAATEAALRRAHSSDAPAILSLVETNLEAGHLLPRGLEELMAHAPRFLVIEADARVVACAELAPLSRLVAEVRSLVVDGAFRGRGLGSSLIEALQEWARREGFATLCAFTHEPSVFVRLGFSIVPHQWIPEKIMTDCVGCPKFRICGQYATALSLPDAAHDGDVTRVRSSALPPISRPTAEPPSRSFQVLA